MYIYVCVCVHLSIHFHYFCWNYVCHVYGCVPMCGLDVCPQREGLALFSFFFPLAEFQTLQYLISYQFSKKPCVTVTSTNLAKQISASFSILPGPIPVTPQAVPPTEPASFPASSAALAEFLRRFGGFGRGQRPRCWQQLLGLPGDRTAGSDGAAWQMGRFLTDVNPTGKAFKETRARKRDDVVTNSAYRGV